MAVGIVSELLQDALLTDCYDKLNNRKYACKFVNVKGEECNETFHLLHIIDDFDEKSDKETLMSNIKYWVKFEHEFPYINTSRIAMNYLYKMPLSRGFLQYIPENSTQPKVAKVISVGKISRCQLVSAERVDVKGTTKSVKQVKFRYLSQEMELASACVCHVFNRKELTCNVWNGEFTAGTKFGQAGLIGVATASVRDLPDVPDPSLFIPIYNIRNRLLTSDDLQNNALQSVPYFRVDNKLAELPRGSLALICHTIQRYDIEKISFGIQWIAVIATPDSETIVDFEHDRERELSPD
ncbi:hypothetical protein BDP27DRAFT_1427324 [Rhodocollybia butyracea]|uniref:Uncharacterized protein n=1 Tax=Rhodocollybia butyracea TaxID=206335 RepID=A0A9P5PJ58_9AGAR|nr:hypothetical protein BDP27DRAFT_1427324 [Rhodocollybia butyracea]